MSLSDVMLLIRFNINIPLCVMDKFLFLSVLLSISAFTKGDDVIVNNGTESGDSFPHAAVSSSVGSLVFIILLIWLIYYCCNRNQTPEGFTQFSNEDGRNPPGRSRWRNRRFFRRNRRQNHYQNNVEARNSTHVTIQPVLTIGTPSADLNFAAPAREGRTVPMAPPAYDDSMNNQPIPSQFMNPPMPNQFINPPMPNQFINPPTPSQYMNPTAPSQFLNTTQNNFNNSSVPSNFNNPPMMGNFRNQCMPSNSEQSRNPNTSSYHTKH